MLTSSCLVPQDVTIFESRALRKAMEIKWSQTGVLPRREMWTHMCVHGGKTTWRHAGKAATRQPRRGALGGTQSSCRVHLQQDWSCLVARCNAASTVQYRHLLWPAVIRQYVNGRVEMSHRFQAHLHPSPLKRGEKERSFIDFSRDDFERL